VTDAECTVAALVAADDEAARTIGRRSPITFE
jgi:hypothetical protein